MKCRNCGERDVEQERECYATPVCFACLPPPEPLPVRPWPPLCPDCRHRHAGGQLGYICIGCPCQRRHGDPDAKEPGR